jgi:hypothetical protein
MNTQIVPNRAHIVSLGPEHELVHLEFRPTKIDLLKIYRTCPSLKALHLSSSYKDNISKSGKDFLTSKGIKLLHGGPFSKSRIGWLMNQLETEISPSLLITEISKHALLGDELLSFFAERGT